MTGNMQAGYARADTKQALKINAAFYYAASICKINTNPNKDQELFEKRKFPPYLLGGNLILSA